MLTDKLFIRADVNEQIGTGHVMRCFSIAKKLRKTEVTFVVADHNSERFITDKGYHTLCLESAWNDMESELDKLQQLLLENGIKTILVDHYYVTETYLKSLSSCVEVIYIDDLNIFPYSVSTLINYNIYAEDISYTELYDSLGYSPRFLLGTKYAPVRDEFQNISFRTFSGIKNIMISTGGTDEYNMIDKILDRIHRQLDFSSYCFYCVVGKYSSYKQHLQKKYSDVENVNLLYNINNMSDYMKKCDLCITASGTTVYELCACGTPSILFTLADNQWMVAKKMSDLGLMNWIGDVRNNVDDCLDQLVNVWSMYNDKEYWETVSRKMQHYVDGDGALRIAREIMS